ncbi:MAG: hypothetical protein KF809_10700 [Chloroflexi bacterium]|nr:hypothetical protein [Chloroflexota bacterium]
MTRHGTTARTTPVRPARRPAAAIAGLLAMLWIVTIGVARAAEPSPVVTATGLLMRAEPLLGGAVRPGSWMGVRVHLENDGPAVTGELQLTGGQGRDSRYSVPVELPTGARQEHLLHGQPTWAGGRVTVSLVTGDTTPLQQQLRLTPVDPYVTSVVIVAERPDVIAPDIRAALSSPFRPAPRLLLVAPEDLPARPEAWAAIDRLVWQDVDPARLTDGQRDALVTWVGAGGSFIAAGGQTGLAGVTGLPEPLLPFRPEATIDVPATDLATLTGPLATGTASLPALSGPLVRGGALATSGDRVIGAQASIGQGRSVLMGIDPGSPAIGDPGAIGVWRQALGPMSGQATNPLVLQDDTQLVGALGALPAVAVPDLGLLFAILLCYIVLVGPIDYLVLRHFDRLGWAWVTMPVLVAVFSAVTYGVGMGLRGTSVIVDQVAIVRAATGSDRGLAQVYVGVFSPDRRTFDVAVGGDVLLANPISTEQAGGGVPLDVVAGSTTRLRGYQVGFGVMRAFRAEAPVTTPVLEAELSYAEGILSGWICNASDVPIDAPTVSWAGAAQVLPTLAPGDRAEIRLDVGARSGMGGQLSRTMLPGGRNTDQRTIVRRAVVDQVTMYGAAVGSGLQANPVVLGFVDGPTLPIDTGGDARHEGDALYLWPVAPVVVGRIVVPNALMAQTQLESRALESSQDGPYWSLSQGWAVAELRPVVALEDLRPSALSIRISQDGMLGVTGRGLEVQPLPPAEQPPQDDPMQLPNPPEPRQGPNNMMPLPAFQLFDRTTGQWVEFPTPTNAQEMRIPDPARYVDATGAIRLRLIARDPQMGVWFGLGARIEGLTR